MEKLLFFTGDDCPSCKVVKQQLKENYPEKWETLFEERNVSQKEIAKEASRYSVMSLPTVIHLKDGAIQNSYVGSGIVSNLVDAGVL